jgi:hypothetical protein
MSIWTFIVVMLLLLILVAAAVILPLFLIVFPRQRHTQQAVTQQDALGHCPTVYPCSNDGVSVVSDNACRCICTGGYTGSQCNGAVDPECTTIDVAGDSQTFRSATLGSSVPRIITDATANFSIPLNNTQLLSLFSANNLSCTSENSLITFNAESSKPKRFIMIPEFERPSSPHSTGTAGPAITARAEPPPPLLPRETNTVGTSAGIVFQQTTTTTSALSATATLSAAGAANTSFPTTAGGGSSTTLDNLSQATLDFARLTVLFVLDQTSNISAAINTQQRVQAFFLDGNATGVVELAYNGLSANADFGTFGLGFGDGIVLGGKGDGQGGLS